MSMPDFTRADSENECITNPAGNGYRGKLSKTPGGFQCMNWTLVNDLNLVASLPDKDITVIQNYCRHTAASELGGVSCVVNIDDVSQVEVECAVPFCGNVLLFLITLYHILSKES